jgi:hypothetical protein
LHRTLQQRGARRLVQSVPVDDLHLRPASARPAGPACRWRRRASCLRGVAR